MSNSKDAHIKSYHSKSNARDIVILREMLNDDCKNMYHAFNRLEMNRGETGKRLSLYFSHFGIPVAKYNWTEWHYKLIENLLDDGYERVNQRTDQSCGIIDKSRLMELDNRPGKPKRLKTPQLNENGLTVCGQRVMDMDTACLNMFLNTDLSLLKSITEAGYPQGGSCRTRLYHYLRHHSIPIDKSEWNDEHYFELESLLKRGYVRTI